MDDRGYPDQTDDQDTLLHNIEKGPVLWKLRHPPPLINEVDPSFDFPFNDALHSARLHQQLNLSHLDDALQARIFVLVKKYWSVFDERGVWVPVKYYECVIDTGDATPTAVNNIQYGPKELPVMRKAIAGLKQVGHIRQIHNRRWLFKCVLAAKPNQEHIRDINDFVWRFCVNYQPLNSVTRIILQFQLVPRLGSLNKSTHISCLSEIQTVKLIQGSASCNYPGLRQRRYGGSPSITCSMGRGICRQLRMLYDQRPSHQPRKNLQGNSENSPLLLPPAPTPVMYSNRG